MAEAARLVAEADRFVAEADRLVAEAAAKEEAERTAEAFARVEAERLAAGAYAKFAAAAAKAEASVADPQVGTPAAKRLRESLGTQRASLGTQATPRGSAPGTPSLFAVGTPASRQVAMTPPQVADFWAEAAASMQGQQQQEAVDSAAELAKLWAAAEVKWQQVQQAQPAEAPLDQSADQSFFSCLDQSKLDTSLGFADPNASFLSCPNQSFNQSFRDRSSVGSEASARFNQFRDSLSGLSNISPRIEGRDSVSSCGAAFANVQFRTSQGSVSDIASARSFDRDSFASIPNARDSVASLPDRRVSFASLPSRASVGQESNVTILPGRESNATLPGRESVATLPSPASVATLPGRESVATLPGRESATPVRESVTPLPGRESVGTPLSTGSADTAPDAATPRAAASPFVPAMAASPVASPAAPNPAPAFSPASRASVASLSQMTDVSYMATPLSRKRGFDQLGRESWPSRQSRLSRSALSVGSLARIDEEDEARSSTVLTPYSAWSGRDSLRVSGAAPLRDSFGTEDSLEAQCRRASELSQQSPVPEEIQAQLEAGAALPDKVGQLYLLSFPSVPPQPDPELLLEINRMEVDPEYTIELHPGHFVSQKTVLEEHLATCPSEAFRLYRERVTWQMVKRRWFSTLTEFNTREFFQKWEPARLVAFVEKLLARFGEEFGKCGSLDDPLSVASLAQRKIVQVIFKGGNSIALLKGNANQLLPAEVAKTLEKSKPKALSDLDFLAVINYAVEPELRDPSCYKRVHAEVRACVSRALLAVADALEQGVGSGDPEFANFADMLCTKDRAALSAELVSLLQGSLHALWQEIEHAHNDSCVQIPGGLMAFFQQFDLSQAKVLPSAREHIAIHDDEANGAKVQISLHGDPRKIYISDNPDIAFKDLRCVNEKDHCAFSLVRALVGFTVDAKLVVPGLQLEVDPELHRFTKGEYIDVSIPKLEDIAHGMALAGQEQDPRMRPRTAVLKAGDVEAAMEIESIDSLIGEQRELSFGRRMQSLLIWRIAKVSKRLTRLIELCGIKALCLKHSWKLKQQAFDLVAKRLERVAHRTLPALLEGREPGTTPPKRRRLGQDGRRMTSLGNAHHQAEEAWGPMTNPGRAEERLESRIEEVVEACRLQDMLLDPLDSLVLKVFSDAMRKELPGNFVHRWQETLEPLVQLARSFATAFGQLHALHARGEAPAVYAEEQLYHFDLGHEWRIFS